MEGFIAPLKVSASLLVVGLVPMALGSGLAPYAQWHMGNSWRIGAADGMQGSIVSDGPFAYSRNPVFVGQIALFSGLGMTHPTILQTAVLFLVIFAAIFQVRIDERDLGLPYADYRRQVRRWL